MVTVFVNGIPGASAVMKIAKIDPPPYGVWKTGKFTPTELADPAISGDTADPDHDGIVNLLEYAQALEPKLPDAAGLPTAGQQDGYLTITYRLNQQATDVSIFVESSTDLTAESWFPVGVETGRVDMGGYWLVTVRDGVPTASAPRRFMRLQVKTP